jgi:hypothetical protein
MSSCASPTACRSGRRATSACSPSTASTSRGKLHHKALHIIGIAYYSTKRSYRCTCLPAAAVRQPALKVPPRSAVQTPCRRRRASTLNRHGAAASANAAAADLSHRCTPLTAAATPPPWPPASHALHVCVCWCTNSAACHACWRTRCCCCPSRRAPTSRCAAMCQDPSSFRCVGATPLFSELPAHACRADFTVPPLLSVCGATGWSAQR